MVTLGGERGKPRGHGTYGADGWGEDGGISRGGAQPDPECRQRSQFGDWRFGNGVFVTRTQTCVCALPVERVRGSALGTVPKNHPEPVSTPGNSWMPESPSLSPAPVTSAHRAAGGRILHSPSRDQSILQGQELPWPWVGGETLPGRGTLAWMVGEPPAAPSSPFCLPCTLSSSGISRETWGRGESAWGDISPGDTSPVGQTDT